MVGHKVAWAHVVAEFSLFFYTQLATSLGMEAGRYAQWATMCRSLQHATSAAYVVLHATAPHRDLGRLAARWTCGT